MTSGSVRSRPHTVYERVDKDSTRAVRRVCGSGRLHGRLGALGDVGALAVILDIVLWRLAKSGILMNGRILQFQNTTFLRCSASGG